MSENTFCRRLQLSEFLSFRSAKIPLISLKYRKARTESPNAHKHWSINDCKRVLWNNESNYNLKGPDSNLKVCRRKR